MRYETVTEGETMLKVPVADKLTKKNEVFYNPVMELDRDITCAFLKTVKPADYLDLLAACGARGVRAIVEAGCQATLNDLNPMASKLIKGNLALNGVEGEVTGLDARCIPSPRRYDIVDVDPFGPPVEFMDSCLKHVRNKGHIAVTATDTSALCGSYPNACRRKYDAVPLRTGYYNELGLRILTGFIARSALRHGYGITVKFAHNSRHFMRVIAQVDGRGGAVRDTLKSLKYITHCHKCLERGYILLGDDHSCDCAGNVSVAGRLWSEMLADKKTCDAMITQIMENPFNCRKDAVRICELVKGEQDTRKPYYDLHKLASKLKVCVPRQDDVMNGLRDAGFKVSRTHYNPRGLKTDASVKDIGRLLE
ncbi:tRNA (guanine(10)-N(2))-dimethyltransferase [Candidatus Altiarchaeota archaeon]